MRILVDLSSHVTGDPKVTQVEKTPPLGAAGSTSINGKYVIPVPSGMDFRVDANDYVLAAGVVDGGDVTSITYAHLLAAFPMFGHVYFNPLLTGDHVGELDLTAQWKDTTGSPPAAPTYYPTRAQTGRGTGPPDAGQMPTHTAILAQNSSVTPSRPGILISDAIDISTFTGGVGADEFMLYWKLYDFEIGDDVISTFGATAGQNEPAIRRVLEVDQEPSGFSAYISVDDGANWCEAGLLEPMAFANKSTEIRVAFRNTTASKVYLATFGALF